MLIRDRLGEVYTLEGKEINVDFRRIEKCIMNV